ncbi:MAG TPA: HEAT repeat domain-containing protein [Planctomycetota bacterium]|nr:HEAT repeat domain-containing protein [Planctomycetota bacterium]
MKPLLILLTAVAVAHADEVELTSGTVVEGKVEDLGDSIRVVKSAGSAVYPKSMVRKITPKKTVEELYEERSSALKDADVDGHLQLARWAAQQKLVKEALVEFRKVVALNPDHEEARVAAGFQKVNGKWLTEDEANQARGLVKHKGKWMTPEQRDLDNALEEQKELDKAIVHEVGVQIGHLKSPVEKTRQDAVAALARIEDKHKVKAYIAAIPSPQRELRKFVFQELGRMKDVTALRPLVRRSLWDEDEDLRPVAFRAVQDIGYPDTALFYVPFLAEESISARIRCVDAMALFKDLRVAPALLQALENNMDLTRQFDKEGEAMTQLAGRTITMGDGSSITLPRSVRFNKADPLDKNSRSKLQQEKASLIGTLGMITGQNFGDDIAKWRAWLQSKKAGNG